jgi:hypothetical protein
MRVSDAASSCMVRGVRKVQGARKFVMWRAMIQKEKV